MGDCYSVELRVKVDPGKTTKAKLQKQLRQWMRDASEPRVYPGIRRPGVEWNLQELRKSGIRPDSFHGICKILLAFQQGGQHKVDEEGFAVYNSGFNASYGWHRVMVAAFGQMVWALKEGSHLYIDHDEGVDRYEVRPDEDGEMTIWTNISSQQLCLWED